MRPPGDPAARFIEKLRELYPVSSEEQQSMRDEMDAQGAALIGDLSTRTAAEYSGALWRPSPNFNRGRPDAPDRIVLHITDGQPLLERAVQHLRKPASRVSAHFLIGQAGEVVQLVQLKDTAWHARGVNGRSVGIEHIARTPGELGPDDPGLPLTAPQLAASAQLVRWLSTQLAIPLEPEHLVPHCEVPGTTHSDCARDVTRGGIWPWESYWMQLRAE